MVSPHFSLKNEATPFSHSHFLIFSTVTIHPLVGEPLELDAKSASPSSIGWPCGVWR